MRSFSLEITDEGRQLKDEHDRRDQRLARAGLEAILGAERDRFVELFGLMAQELVARRSS